MADELIGQAPADYINSIVQTWLAVVWVDFSGRSFNLQYIEDVTEKVKNPRKIKETILKDIKKCHGYHHSLDPHITEDHRRNPQAFFEAHSRSAQEKCESSDDSMPGLVDSDGEPAPAAFYAQAPSWSTRCSHLWRKMARRTLLRHAEYCARFLQLVQGRKEARMKAFEEIG